MIFNKLNRVQRGFTLVELLIVIAILGVLTTAVLVAINPTEQFARGRDAGRLNAVDQLGHSIQSYYTANTATYLPVTTDWEGALVTAQEIKNEPVNPTATGYTTGCNTAASIDSTGGTAGGYCYAMNGTDAIVYARAEATSNKSKCATMAWIAWKSSTGKTDIICTAAVGTDPTP